MNSQSEIVTALGVAQAFEATTETRKRTSFLRDYLRSSGLNHYVLGISGGVDSLAAGLLAKRSVLELRQEGYSAGLVAVRLPYGHQLDEEDAQLALSVIKPDRIFTINVKPAADAMLDQIKRSGVVFPDAAKEDFLLGNIKARQRMVAQYTLAGALGGLVIGTDHAAEAVMGFFTKFGDGAADVLPLAGLNKRRVRAMATVLGAPARLVSKIPTADLETRTPQRPDEEAYGVTYDQIDDFLEGKAIDADAMGRIVRSYAGTAHKRALPVTADSWERSSEATTLAASGDG